MNVIRTTIRLDERLLRKAKRLAAESGRTLSAVIEDSLRETLARRGSAGRHERVRLHTIGGGGVRPEVDLDDTAALLDVMES